MGKKSVLSPCPRCGVPYASGLSYCPTCGMKAQKKKNPLKIILILVLVLALAGGLGFGIFRSYQQKVRQEQYDLGRELMEKGSYQEAREAFLELGDYSDAPELAVLAEKAAHYTAGKEAFGKQDYAAAQLEFTQAGDYEDAAGLALDCEKALHYLAGAAAYEKGDADTAIGEFTLAEDWEDAEAMLTQAKYLKTYQQATALMDQGQLEEAASLFSSVGSFSDAQELKLQCYYALGTQAMDAGKYSTALEYFKKTLSYSDSKVLLGDCSLILGKEKLEEKNFASALSFFEQAKTNGSQLEPQLDNYILLCKAEKEFLTGTLTKGIEYYEQLPQSFKPGEFDISARRGMLSRLKSFAKLEGRYKSETYDVKVTYSSGGWMYTNYFPEGTLKNQTLTLSCKLNNDGTVTVTGKAVFTAFTSFSYYTFIPSDTDITLNFTMENLTWLPGTYKIDSDTSISFSGNPRILYQKFVGNGSAVSNVTYDVKQ